MPDFSISVIDWIILLFYFAFIMWRGIGYAKKHENAEDYFLAGRSLTWPIIGLSLFASNISSSSLIGMAASGALAGIITGIISAAFFLSLSGSKWMPAIHFLYVATLIFVMSGLAIFVVSLLTPPPPEEKVENFSWHRKIYDRETKEVKRLPVIWNYRCLSVLLIAFLVLILLLFG